MTPKEILDMARVIQYPDSGKRYKEYSVEGKEITKLPLTKFLYAGWRGNAHHYTTAYQRNTALPIIADVLGFGYSRDQFTVRKIMSGQYDISMLVPRKEFRYEIYGYTRGEHHDGLSYDDITSCRIENSELTGYHRLYMYPHECSRLINKTLDNGRILFISGDSQMIPNIGPMSAYFQEIWYFDNRNKMALRDKFRDVTFTDALVELNANTQEKYLDFNLR